MRNYGSRENRREAASFSPQEFREGTITAVRNIVRRLGVVLGAALDAAIGEMIQHDMIASAEELRDQLKPLVDALVHFEVEDVDGEE